MKRIIRNRRLTKEEAEEYRKIREQVAQELPELLAQHDARMAARKKNLNHDSSQAMRKMSLEDIDKSAQDPEWLLRSQTCQLEGNHRYSGAVPSWRLARHGLP